MRIAKLFLLLPLFALIGLSRADNAVITVSTANTPSDRRALQEISKEAFARIGLDFKLANLPSERSLAAANAGEVDGEGLRVGGLGAQYPNLIQVPERC